MTEEMKVYCLNCKSYREIYGDMWGYAEQCRYFRTKNHDYRQWWRGYGKPSVLNKKNNCPNYKRTWWKFWVK